MNATSTPWAPWYVVVPADHRWFRNYVVARVVAATLEALDPRFPEPPEEIQGVRGTGARRDLGAEPAGSARSCEPLRAGRGRS